MDKWQAQQAYWGGFGLEAYNALTVPDEAKQILDEGGMYITYSPVNGSLNGTAMSVGSLWYKGRSWATICQKTSIIEQLADREIKIDGGAVKFRKPTSNFAQPMSDPNDENVRRMVLSVEVEFLSN